MVEVSGIDGRSAEAASTWSSPSVCRPHAGGEEEDDLLHRVGPTCRRDTETVSKLASRWAGYWASAHWPSLSLFSSAFYFPFLFLF
jgi:hypothetical protein